MQGHRHLTVNQRLLGRRDDPNTGHRSGVPGQAFLALERRVDQQPNCRERSIPKATDVVELFTTRWAASETVA